MSGLGFSPYLADMASAFIGPPAGPAPAPIGPPADPVPQIGPPSPPVGVLAPPHEPVGVLAPPPVAPVGVLAPPPDVAAPAGPPGAAPPEDPLAFPLQAQATGGAPAQELDLRGPRMLTAQNVRNGAFEDAIGTVAERNQDDSAQAYDLALAQERDARARAAAIEQSAAEQEEEMAQRQADFDTTTKQLGRLGQIDRGRFWASRSTAGKVAGVIEMMLAGLRNAPSLVNKAIDDDVRAQEMAYMAGRDTLNAKQTAFSMAMNKYQQAGAARAVSRAAAIDVMQAQLAQHAAQHQGTESANRATLAIADLQNEKLAQFQQAYRYMPAQGGGRRWVDPRTGLIYSEAEAKAMMAKREEWGQDDRKVAAGIGGQVMLEGMKQQAAGAPGGPTREQLGKQALEREEVQMGADQFREQIDALKNHPAITETGLGTKLASFFGPRAAPSAARHEQDLEAINTQVLQAIGKVAKDADGKPNKVMIEKLEKRFDIHLTDTPAIKLQKLQGALDTYNALALQQGARVPRPNGAIGEGELPASAKLHGKR